MVRSQKRVAVPEGPLKQTEINFQIDHPISILLQNDFYDTLKQLVEGHSLDLNAPFITGSKQSNWTGTLSEIDIKQSQLIFGSVICKLVDSHVNMDSEHSLRCQRVEQLVDLGADLNAFYDPADGPPALSLLANKYNHSIWRPLDACSFISFDTAFFSVFDLLVENGLMNFGTSGMFHQFCSKSILVSFTFSMHHIESYFHLNIPTSLASQNSFSQVESEVRTCCRKLVSLGFGRGPALFETDPGLFIEREGLSQPLEDFLMVESENT